MAKKKKNKHALYSVSQIAEMFEIDRRRIKEAIEAGEIKAKNFASEGASRNRYMMTKQEVTRWVNSGGSTRHLQGEDE